MIDIVKQARDIAREVTDIATNIALEELVQLGIVTRCEDGVYRLTEFIDDEDNQYLLEQWNDGPISTVKKKKDGN